MSHKQDTKSQCFIEPYIRDLDYLPRFQIVRTRRTQSVAAHSFFVSIYAIRMADMIGWIDNRAELLQACLTHDLDELIVGDMPRVTKNLILKDPTIHPKYKEIVAEHMIRKFPWVVESTDLSIRLMVHAADTLEAAAFIAEEISMGNSSVSVLYDSVRGSAIFGARSAGGHFENLGFHNATSILESMVTNTLQMILDEPCNSM